MDSTRLRAAVVDYGLGNLFSVGQAAAWAGFDPEITSDRKIIASADAVILPGVGAYGDAMAMLRRLDLVQPLRDLAEAGRPLMGICLGLQLLFSESTEFGSHQGLGIIPGRVVKFEGLDAGAKVPQVGWNAVRRPGRAGDSDPWQNTPLQGMADGQYMYFVHSYYARPDNPEVILSTTVYGGLEFCSSVRRGNVIAFQFHPERSGPAGLAIYRRAAELILGRPLGPNETRPSSQAAGPTEIRP